MTEVTEVTAAPAAPAARAVILLRVFDGNAAARQRFKGAAVDLQQRAEVPVLAAYLRRGSRGTDLLLGAAVEQLLGQSALEIAVVPFEVELAHPEVYDLPDLLNDLAEAHPGVRFRLASPLALDAGLVGVAARRLEQAWSDPAAGEASPRQVAAIAGQTPIGTATLKDGALPALPPQAQHVFVCFGRRCMEEGSADTYRALNERLTARGLDGGPERVKLSRSKCLSPCQAAPVALCYPSATYYARLTPEAVPDFIDQALVAGGDLPGHAFKAGA